MECPRAGFVIVNSRRKRGQYAHSSDSSERAIDTLTNAKSVIMIKMVNLDRNRPRRQTMTNML